MTIIKITANTSDADIQEMIELANGPERLAAYNKFTGKDTSKFASTKKGIAQTVKAAIAYRDSLCDAEDAVDAPVVDEPTQPTRKPSKPTTVHAKRAEGVARSWQDADVRARRSARHSVIVNGEQYRSVRAAFKALNLPLKEHIAFRMLLKEQGKMNEYGYKWKLVANG
jgi:hypothetical protein